MNEQLIVPFHVADVGDTEADAVASVVRSGWLTMGPRTLEFEKEFAKVVSARHAIQSSCTAALHLALEAIGIKEGDEVLVPTTTFTASAEVVAYLGAIPRSVDVDPETLNLSVADAEGRVTPRTRRSSPCITVGSLATWMRFMNFPAATTFTSSKMLPTPCRPPIEAKWLAA